MNIYQANPSINCIKNRQVKPVNIGFQSRHNYRRPDLGDQLIGGMQNTARFVQRRALPIGMATLTTATLGGGYAAYRAGVLPEMNLPSSTPTELKEGMSARQVKSSALANSPVLVGAAGGRHIPVEPANQKDLVYVGEVGIPARSNDIQIHEDTVKPLQQMITDARSQGVDLVVVSGYRSTERQQQIFQSKGQACEVRSEVSALPGTSQHETGYAVDLGIRNNPATDVEDTFNGTPEANWIRNNASKYGFALPYAGNTPFNQAGVAREDWHITNVQTPEAQRVLAPVIDTLNGRAQLTDIGCDSSRVYTPQDRNVNQQPTSSVVTLPRG